MLAADTLSFLFVSWAFSLPSIVSFSFFPFFWAEFGSLLALNRRAALFWVVVVVILGGVESDTRRTYLE